MSEESSEKAKETQQRRGSPLMWTKIGPETETPPKPQEDDDGEEG